MLVVCKTVLAFVLIVAVNSQEECIKGPSTWYQGTRSTTGEGLTCQRWDVTVPHKPNHIPKDGGHHNYCRNPDGDLKGTWCYTTDNATRWQYCNITKCEDNSLVIWTNYDGSSESTHLLSVKADPEIVKQKTDSTGTFNVTVVTGTNKTMSEFWALAASYGEKSLYFTDYRSEYVGIRRIQNNMTLRLFEGMAHGIESMAFDWKTKNLYWTDSEFKWVMVAEDTYQYYVPVYRTEPDPPYGLAIHAVKRQLIFSTYKALGSKIISTDLAGKNPQVLFKFPEVFDVTGITVDYTDDRIYWTDFTGYGGMVMSSLLDGSNKTQHHYRGGSIFWGVAAYLDYLYVTDVHARYSVTAEKFYSVWIINKESKQTFRYTLNGKPRGISVYSENEEFSLDEDLVLGECDSNALCDHICLPRVNATRECACSLGYHLESDGVSCKPKLINDEYLLIADAGQGKLFQVPINSSGDVKNDNYSVVPLQAGWKAVTVAVDAHTKYLYWSDKKTPSVSRVNLDGSRSKKVASKHANSIAVDPQTGNVFWSDSESDYIYISQPEQDFKKVIVYPEPDKSNSSIRMIVQDLKHRYLYWTDTNSVEGKGEVVRCRFDGTEKTVVMKNLNWPHAITIDYALNSLFVAEAKLALIHELDLDKLNAKTTDFNLTQTTSKQHDVSPYISKINPYIIDIKVHHDHIYVVDGKSSRLERFNLTLGPASMKPYGPAEFFRVTTVSVYSKAIYEKYIQTITNPCQNALCRHACVAVADDDYVCLCPDGEVAIAFICVANATATTPTPDSPPVPINCPDDITIRTSRCETGATVIWSPPSWNDDITPVTSLRIVKPIFSPPYKFSEGNFNLFYTATDSSNKVGHCSFQIKVESVRCPDAPSARPGMQKSAATCGTLYGSSLNITCIDNTQKVSSMGKLYDRYTLTCQAGGYWSTSMSSDAKCVSPTTTAPSTTTSTSTTGTTTTISTTSSTTQTTTTTTQRTTTTPITTTQITTTTTIPTTTTTTTTPTTTSTTQSSSTKPTGSSTVSTSKATVSTTTANGTVGVAEASSGSGGLSGGAAAGIAILVIALVIIIVVIVVVTIRNRPIWEVSKFSFPVFWKTKSDDAVNMGTASNTAPYEIMS